MENNNSILFLKFLLTNKNFAVNTSEITEVNFIPEISPLYGANDIYAGLINLHGESVPLINSDILITGEKSKNFPTLFIALKKRKHPVCLLIEGVTGFEKINERKIQSSKNLDLKYDNTIIKSIYLKSKKQIPILNTDFIYHKLKFYKTIKNLNKINNE